MAKTIKVKVKVIDSAYIKNQKQLCLYVELADGRRKTVAVPSDAFTCRYGNLDDELEKTARMFIGKRINIEMSDEEFEEGKMLGKISPPKRS